MRCSSYGACTLRAMPARSRLLVLVSALAMSACALVRCEPDEDAALTAFLPANACPRVTPGVRAGTLASDALDEISGLVESRAQPGVLWVHNDSGDRARVFAVARDGRLLAEIVLDGVEARDIEDIALGPGPKAGADFLYLADTGDNLRRRDSVQIQRLEEPKLTQGPGLLMRKERAFSIEVTYEDGPRDAETLFADARTGDLYLVEKRKLFTRQWRVGVYRLPADEVRAGNVRARRVGTIGLGPVSGGDMLPDGSGFAVRNYRTALYFARGPGESVAEALTRGACQLPLADTDRQGEALGFAADGSGYLTTSEGEHAPIFVYRFVP